MNELDEYFEERKREIERDEKIARFGMAIFYSFVALIFIAMLGMMILLVVTTIA